MSKSGEQKYLKSALEKYALAYIRYVKSALKNAKPFSKIDTGKLYDSFKYKISDIENELELEITAADYIMAVNDGTGGKGYNTKERKPPSHEILTAWVKRRLGYQGKKAEQVGWAVQKKIRKFGTKPTHVLETARAAIVNDTSIIKGLNEATRNDLIDYIDQSLAEVAKKYGFRQE